MLEYNINELTSELLVISRLKQNKKTIITGLDGTGKSTLISKIYPVMNCIKFNHQTNAIWDKAYKECLSYDVFDRHPLIDFPVHNYVQNIGGDDYKMNQYFNEFIEKNELQYKVFSYIFYLNVPKIKLGMNDRDPSWAIDDYHRTEEAYNEFLGILDKNFNNLVIMKEIKD